MQYEELFAAVDELAERLRALGIRSPGGLATLAALSEIEEVDAESLPASRTVEHLVEAHELVVRNAMKLRKAAEEVGDLETQDMIITRIQIHQKTLWMLGSFLKR